jgi:hypothetical protein
MSRSTPKRDPIAAATREAVAQRRVGFDARCECGEDRAVALIRKEEDICCAACARRKQGKRTMDKHHVAGKANSPVTISIPVNDHRAQLNEDQYDWPKKTLENPDRSPLLAAAGCIRGFINTFVYLCEKVLLWIAEMLELLDEYLCQIRGAGWWLQSELKNFVFGGFHAAK